MPRSHATTRRMRYALIAGASVSIILSGCSLQEPADGGGGGQTTGGTFVYASPGVPDHLDQTPWGGQPSKLTYAVIASTLVQYQGECDVLGQSDDLAPGLAESWEIAEDGSGVTFHLGDAKSAAGNEITAEDVRWSVERQLELEAFIPSALGFIGRYDIDNLVTVIDEKTVKMNTLESSSFDVMQFASTLLTIHDSATALENATDDDPWASEFLKKNTANFGPWQVERFEPGTEIVFEPNENYTGERGNVESVIIKAVPDSATRMQLLRSGDVSWADSLTFAEYAELDGVADVTVENCVSADRDDLMLQQAGTVFADPRVRQAVSMAIDREQIVTSIYRGFGEPAMHGVPQYYEFPEPENTYEYDPEGAKALLAEAGHPDGISFTALFSSSRPGPQVEQVAVQVQADLAKAGITMELNRVAGAAEFFQLVREHRYEAVFYSDSTFVGDASYGAAAFTLSTSNINTFGYASAEYDELVAEARRATGAERDQAISDIADLGTTDMPIVYLVDSSNVQAHRSDITGFTNSPMRTVNPAQLNIGGK